MPVPDVLKSSRKWTGMVLVGVFLVVALVAFLTASTVLALTGHPGALDWTPVRDTMAFISGNGFVHQISQGASDVSKWRASGNSAATRDPGDMT